MQSLTVPRSIVAMAGDGNDLRVVISIDGEVQTIRCKRFVVESVYAMRPLAMTDDAAP